MIYIPIPNIRKKQRNSMFFVATHLLNSNILWAKTSSNSVTIYIDACGGGTDGYSEIIQYRLQHKLPTKLIIDYSLETFNITEFERCLKDIPEINLVSAADILIIHNTTDIRSYTPVSKKFKTLPLDFYMVDTYYKCMLDHHPYNNTLVTKRKNGLNLLIGKIKTRFGRFLASYYFYKHDLLSTAVLGLNAYPDDIENMMKLHTAYLDYDYFNTIKNYLGPADDAWLLETNEGVTAFTGWPFDPVIFDNSSVSYVCETFDIDKANYPWMITEKICRSFINRHPFVVQGAPGQLDLLKSLGFQTFSDIISEDYNNYKTSNFEHVEKTVLAGKELMFIR